MWTFLGLTAYLPDWLHPGSVLVGLLIGILGTSGSVLVGLFIDLLRQRSPSGVEEEEMEPWQWTTSWWHRQTPEAWDPYKRWQQDLGAVSLDQEDSKHPW